MEQLLVVGSYASAGEEGIAVLAFDTETGSFRRIQGTAGLESPSFLTMNRDRTRLYAVSETDPEPGTAASYAFDGQSGELTLLSLHPTHGSSACHVRLDKQEKFALVINYGGGQVCLYPVAEDGSLGPMADSVLHEGSGPRQDRQEKAHPHSSIFDPAGEFVIVPDLGTDRLYHYRIDREAGKLVSVCESAAAPGAGPRHLVFHPNGKLLYVINELDSTVCVYRYARGDAPLEKLQTIGTLPESFDVVSTCADIHITADGRFVYGSNRGHDSIAVFRTDEEGLLELVDITPCGGRTPRNFALLADDRFLAVGSQDSDCIVSFRVDPDTGRLTPTGRRIDNLKPVCHFPV